MLVFAGCTLPKAQRNLTDTDPTSKIPAIKLAADGDQHAAIEQLVADLDSDDPAIRFYAIRALRDLTGETFDYQYYDDEVERQPALARWQEWLRQRDGQ